MSNIENAGGQFILYFSIAGFCYNTSVGNKIGNKIRHYTIFGGDRFETRAVGNSAGRRIWLIPGLGNGIESYNWNLSTEEQRQKSGLGENFMTSLQDKLAEKYYVSSADPPGYGSNIDHPAVLDDYISHIRDFGPDIIVGHSIGGRLAHYYGEKYKIPYIMLDPTPDYVLDSVYAKYVDSRDLSIAKYRKTAEFLQMVDNVKAEIQEMQMRPAVIIWSVDENDPGVAAKKAYFDSLDCNKIMLHNATHWVHITHPDVVRDEIEKVLTQGGF